MRRHLISSAAFALLVMTTPADAGAAEMPKVYGQTIGEWSAQWWAHMAEIPVAENPLVDETGENCEAGNTGGKVFFLAGNGGGETTRACNVHHSQALFFPLLNYVAWAPEDGADAAALSANAAGAIDVVEDLVCTVDGVPCVATAQVVRQQSPPFGYGPAELFGQPDGKELALADGYWVMLPPLDPGDHVITLGGGVPEFGFLVDVTYELTVD